MPKGGRYFVEPSKGEWILTSNGRTVRRYPTKKQAVDDGVIPGESSQRSARDQEG